MLNLSTFLRNASISLATAGLAVGLLLGGGCSNNDVSGGSTSGAAPASGTGQATVRLAYFPNVTHGVALVGVGRGTFAEALGKDVKLETQVFTAGPAEIEALFAGAVDIGYIGPGPAINGYLKSKGSALKIIAGAASGGAGLVVAKDSGITSIEGLSGKHVAIPQVGGTQDISLRHALMDSGLAPKNKNGTVDVVQYAPAETETQFAHKSVDAAWLPEPWVARLEKAGTATLLIDERDRWPNKQFSTAVVIVSTKFLNEHPDLVKKFLSAHVDSVVFTKSNPEEAQKIIGEEIKEATKKAIPDDILKSALARTDMTYDPLRSSVLTFAAWSRELGYQRDDASALDGIIDEAPLNAVLTERKLAPVK
jgi:NitT/TauT family transport system substrate-binding protein